MSGLFDRKLMTDKKKRTYLMFSRPHKANIHHWIENKNSSTVGFMQHSDL